jgi:hypothetical protein
MSDYECFVCESGISDRTRSANYPNSKSSHIRPELGLIEQFLAVSIPYVRADAKDQRSAPSRSRFRSRVS